jgi:hypothetical protein
VSRVHVVYDERGEVVKYELLSPAEETRRIWRAMMLAPTLEVCKALLRGEKVPTSKLDPDWVKRFGVKS